MPNGKGLFLMNNLWFVPISVILSVALVVTSPAPAFAQVKVLMSNGFKAAYLDLLPDFEKRTGVSVTTSNGPSQGDSPDAIGAQLRRGVQADVVIMSKAGLTDLIANGKIAAGTEVDLAQSPLGVAVRAGSPKPDIGTVEAFKQALLRAKSITFQSVTVIYLRDKLLPRLGITDDVMTKHTEIGPSAVASGAAELAIAPVSEIFHVPGVEYVGTIPAEVQLVQTFSAAVVSGSQEMAASKHLLAFLASGSAKAAIGKNGMEPAN
jgi:molybdate transport system substrate-binding protein